MRTMWIAALGASAGLAMAACGDDDGEKKDTSEETIGDTSSDTSMETAEETVEETTPDSEVVTPTFATLTFTIDDSANATYDATDGLAWKGSFSFDAESGVATFDSAWGGPFIPLYDDGPAPGGHEKPGATAGDHIWSCVVKTPTPLDADQPFEYGAIRGSVDGSDGQWIWSGANGTVTVPHGSEAQVDAPGLVIPEHGAIDLRLTIDVSNDGANLDALFQGVAYSEVEVKGSGWGWSEIALSDDGTHGDTTAADGLFTFVLSEHLAKHDGLFHAGDDPEFIFVLDGVEYKNAAGEGAQAGVLAYSDAAGPNADACVTMAAACEAETIGVAGNGNTTVDIGDEL